MSDQKRRVAITGFGVISPLGNTPEDLWQALQDRRSGVAPIQQFPTETLPFSFGGECQAFSGDIGDFGELGPSVKKQIRKGLKVMCREIQTGVAATQRSIVHAGFGEGSLDPLRTGIVFGSDYITTLPDEFTEGVRACADSGVFELDRWPEDGLPKVTPLWLLKYLPNMPACHVAIYNDLRGPNNSITVREASANLAIAEAYSTIVRNHADVILCGATGSRIHPLRTIHTLLQEQLATGDIAPEAASRPFDKDRQGMVVGEGAATLVLEDLDSAVKRGATIYGEVVGYGSSSVMSRTGLADRATSLANSIQMALRTADKKPTDIGHYHAHGIGTIQCDQAEADAVQRVFGPIDQQPPVVAAKSYTGNMGAGSGMVEIICSVLACGNSQLFDTLNFDTPDPACPVRIAAASDAPGRCFVSASVTPQGQSSAVLIEMAS
ncbi:MAG: beta-ketoacyl-[acyl-carrier-protein] synthase family protein [Pirellulaceae bacterium]